MGLRAKQPGEAQVRGQRAHRGLSAVVVGIAAVHAHPFSQALGDVFYACLCAPGLSFVSFGSFTETKGAEVQVRFNTQVGYGAGR